jgi:hypothetical protein
METPEESLGLAGVLAKNLLLIQRGFGHLCNTLGNIVKAGKDQVDLGAKPPILAIFLLEMGAAIVISLFSTCLLMRLRPARKSATQTGLVSKEVLAEITQPLVEARLLLKEVEQLVERLMEGRVNSEARAEGCYRGLAERKSKRKALIVGINYVGQQGQLKGCHNDASTMEQLLRKECYGFKEFRMLTDNQQAGNPGKKPTARNIKRGFEWLLDGAQPGDKLFFHYSGHGTQVKDSDGDEEDGFDEALCPVSVHALWLSNRHDALHLFLKRVSILCSIFFEDGALGLQRAVVGQLTKRISSQQDGCNGLACSEAGPSERSIITRSEDAQTNFFSSTHCHEASDYFCPRHIAKSSLPLCQVDFEARGVITDDYLRQLLFSRVPDGVELFCFFNCCCSGTLHDVERNVPTRSPQGSEIMAVERQGEENSDELPRCFSTNHQPIKGYTLIHDRELEISKGCSP